MVEVVALLLAHPYALVETGRAGRVLGVHAQAHSIHPAGLERAEGLQKEGLPDPASPHATPHAKLPDPSQITVQGARLPEEVLKLTNR